MPVPDTFIIAPDFTVCEYCEKSYADTAENMHRVMIEKDGARRIHTACVHLLYGHKPAEENKPCILQIDCTDYSKL